MINGLRQNILKSLKQGFRTDGRKFEEFRPVSVEYGVTKNAEGSARVKMGNTEVIAGVKMMIEKPYPDRPDSGSMMIGAELLSMANPEFEQGPPGIWAIEIARVVDRGIRESDAIDVKKLCITKGEKVWMISVDICAINDEGNLLDVSSLATLAAIEDTCFPEYDGESINYKKKTDKKIPIVKKPIEVTVVKIGNYFIVDPTLNEMKALDARLTVACLEDGRICAMQKGGEYPLTDKEIMSMVELCQKKAEELRKSL